ncbi:MULTISPECIES: ABC transporter permease [Nocardiaceae]|uniref:ABC-type transport system involved in multi-copper enzyme maturation permease subunit n=1 Tax=Rhodococcoides corynebacterioides TaxID=53972 RepID=A0ABS2KZG1_9NOCA|nr:MULTISPECIES: ABC transporter permease subunit [Rhodococcus]MBM7417325.1 ABC-type transport system involved in multi-copper enzyme maturation permease subunit [Rhodococcus corynebacterioides]MBP1115578.1 ABC-type transport system involved in multi-copper enzyme maturation permease subunit [Rhodococcus sp. PvP016]
MAARTSSWWSVVGVLIGLELRQRLRTTRWRITLAVTFTVISLAVFGSMYLALSVNEADANYDGWARNLYVVVLGVELFLGVVLAPTLTATSINGDRKDATLAVVQATPISHWQLAVGKLLGSWVSCLALVGVASPYLVWGIVAAPYGIGTSVLGVLVLCLIFLCYCGIGLGYSALTARPAGSAVLTQATVFFLVLGLPALFGLLYSTTSEDHEVVGAEYTYVDDSYDTVPNCRDVASVRSYEHTERIWWLLAPNPFLILPDVVAAHDNPRVRVWTSDERPPDPSVARPIAETLATARTGPYLKEPTCADTRANASNRSFYDERAEFESGKVGDSWYLGLAVNVILGALGLTVAARRLRVPARTLPRGVRIA